MTAREVGPVIADWQAPPAPGPARIEGRFVSLERLVPDRHAPSIHAAAQGQDWLWDYMGNGPYASEADLAQWMREVAGQGDPFFYAFCPAGGPALGYGSLMRIDRANGVVEIGNIMITPPMQRSTAASEAIMLLVGWAFDQGYRRVEWKCNALNLPSRRAAGRYGFSYEGLFRNHMIVKGRNRDTAWYAITLADWPGIRAGWDAWLAPDNIGPDGQQRQRLRLPDPVSPTPAADPAAAR